MNDIPEVKSLLWLAEQFPAVERPQDDISRMQNCIHRYCINAVNFINRQKADIEKLRNENLELKDGYFQKRYEETEHQELVGLREAWRKSQMDYIDLNAEWEGKYKIAKAEAIRAYAKRLKEHIDFLTSSPYTEGVVPCIKVRIEQFAKEMTEGEDV